jgi:hypothetical protein
VLTCFKIMKSFNWYPLRFLKRKLWKASTDTLWGFKKENHEKLQLIPFEVFEKKIMKSFNWYPLRFLKRKSWKASTDTLWGFQKVGSHLGENQHTGSQNHYHGKWKSLILILRTGLTTFTVLTEKGREPPNTGQNQCSESIQLKGFQGYVFII